METTIVLFAIQAGVRLGRKLHEVLIDETRERGLILPVGNLYGNVVENDALDYFRIHPELTASGGPYFGFSRGEKTKAYRTLLILQDQIGDPGGIAGEAREIVLDLHKFNQFREGFGAKPALQRVLGEVVETAIDYFQARPELLAGDTNSRKILSAFIANLDDIEFSDGTPRSIVGDVLLSSLKTLDANVSLVDDDLRLQALLGGIARSLIEDYNRLSSEGERMRRENLIRRIASSALKGGATAFSQNIDLFLRRDPAKRRLVESALSQLLTGITGYEDLFTNESFEVLFKTTLQTLAGHADLLTDREVLQEFIRNTLWALTDDRGKGVFSEESVAVILQKALETVSLRSDALFDADSPRKKLLAGAVRVLAISLASDIGGGRKMKDLFTGKQIAKLAGIVFGEAAKHPERLLSGVEANPGRTAVAQILGSVALALAESPERLLSGEGLLVILKTAFRTAAGNLDKLLNLESGDARTNLLYRVLHQVRAAVRTGGDDRGMVTEEVFQNIVDRILPLASANIEPLLPVDAEPISGTIKKVLALSVGVLENRIDSANLAVLIEKLLARILWGELDLQDDGAFEAAARTILRNAAGGGKA